MTLIMESQSESEANRLDAVSDRPESLRDSFASGVSVVPSGRRRSRCSRRCRSSEELMLCLDGSDPRSRMEAGVGPRMPEGGCGCGRMLLLWLGLRLGLQSADAGSSRFIRWWRLHLARLLENQTWLENTAVLVGDPIPYSAFRAGSIRNDASIHHQC